MTTLAATELRNRGSEAINRVAYSGDRVLLQRHGKNVAAIVSIEDLEAMTRLLFELAVRLPDYEKLTGKLVGRLKDLRRKAVRCLPE